MITRDQMFAPMLKACPAFAPEWDAFLAGENAADVERPDASGPLYHMALGDLARHLVGCLIGARTDHFASVFRVVEEWIVEGDEYVSNAAVVGLLEGLQNNAGHAGVDAEQFCLWLGPESRKEWETLKAF